VEVLIVTENLTDNLPGPAGRRVSPGAGPAQSAYLQGSRLRLLFVALMAGVLAYTFASSIVAPALPFIQHRLGSSVSATAFVLTAFLLTASVASPIMGGLADMYGKKQMFLIALYGLAAGLLVCALGAHSIGWLIAGRTLQGISIGAVTVAFAIVREEFPAEKAPGAMGAVSAGFGIGSGAGVVAAGLIIDAWGYTWIFWTGLVVTAVCVLAGHAWVPRSRQKHPSRIDVAGALLLAGWLAALLLALGQGDAWGWGSPALTVTVVVAVVLFVGWVVYGFRASEPMVDMRILTGRTVLLTNIASIMTGFGLFASFELVPQMVEAPPRRRLRLRRLGDGGRAVPGTAVDCDDLLRSDRWPARRQVRRQTAASVGLPGRCCRLRSPCPSARRPTAGLCGLRAAWPRPRVRVRRHAPPHLGGGPGRQDRRLDRHELRLPYGRQRAGRPDRGHHPHRPTWRRIRRPGGVRIRRRLPGRRRRPRDLVPRHTRDPGPPGGGSNPVGMILCPVGDRASPRRQAREEAGGGDLVSRRALFGDRPRRSDRGS